MKPEKKQQLASLARFFLLECRDGNTHHVHALEQFIVSEVITFEELGLVPAELQRYLLSEARRLAQACQNHKSIEEARRLQGMLTCTHWCQGVVSLKSTGLERRTLHKLLRADTVANIKQMLQGRDPDMDFIRKIIRDQKITAHELKLKPDEYANLTGESSPVPTQPEA